MVLLWYSEGRQKGSTLKIPQGKLSSPINSHEGIELWEFNCQEKSFSNSKNTLFPHFNSQPTPFIGHTPTFLHLIETNWNTKMGL